MNFVEMQELSKIIKGNKKSYWITRKHAIILSMSVLVIGFSGYAFALPNDMTLSNPTTVDMSGHQKSEIHTEEPVGFSSVIENHSTGEKRFMYVVRVLDQNNRIQSQNGMSTNIVPNQSLTVSESWTPQKAGTYTVQTFLLDGHVISNPITNVIETNVVVK